MIEDAKRRKLENMKQFREMQVELDRVTKLQRQIESGQVDAKDQINKDYPRKIPTGQDQDIYVEYIQPDATPKYHLQQNTQDHASMLDKFIGNLSPTS